jgi:DNA polymerase-3 subunit delta
MPMFGGSKIVRATAGRRLGAAALQPFIDDNNLAAALIVEAGNLRPNDSLRALFEKSGKAAAVACFPDEAHDLETLIAQTLKSHGLAIAPDARELLLARVGADRALSRGEIEKLALYAAGKKEVDASDVEAIVGDASELAVDRILSAAASGDAGRAVAEFARAIAAGEDAQAIIGATQRHLQRLHRIRSDIDAGRSFDEAILQLRSRLHFKQKDALALQCRTWTTVRLAEALSRAARAAKAARLAGPLEEPIAEELLMELAAAARRPERL